MKNSATILALAGSVLALPQSVPTVSLADPELSTGASSTPALGFPSIVSEMDAFEATTSAANKQKRDIGDTESIASALPTAVSKFKGNDSTAIEPTDKNERRGFSIGEN